MWRYRMEIWLHKLQYIGKASGKQFKGYYTDHEMRLYLIALGEVVSLIEEAVMSATDRIPPFKLFDVTKLYNLHLRELGMQYALWDWNS